MKYSAITVPLLLLVFILQAQTPKYRVISIPVQKNGITMRDPWAGGMDCPQFSSCDLNQDGIKDLFVFDRVSQKVYTYLGNGGAFDTMFTYAPQYEACFPKNLNSWVLLRDYNHDGIPDIFTHTNNGTCVFKGSIRNGVLNFDLVCPLITYSMPGYPALNVWTNIADIPVFTDVNMDGDLDILTYDVFGSQIAYYENQTMENPGNIHFAADSFKYNLVTSCWGNVSQNYNNNSMSLNVSCKGAISGQQPDPRHSGNTIYSIIDPIYHDVDLLNGNVGFNNLLFMRNCGDNTYANICEWDSIYPTCGTPMLMAQYPAAFGIGNNLDSLEDVLMAPNVYAPYDFSGGGARNVKNVMYYKNNGDTGCTYSYQSDSFLVSHMLDFGSNSKPVFYDFNGDGLMDIVIGNYGYYDAASLTGYLSTLAYYQNTGTAAHPVFTEITLDYDSFSNYNLLGISPAFGDLDGDGKEDLLIGAGDGYLYFFENTGTTGSSFPSMTSADYFNLSTGTYAAPFIYDLNGDSLNDLVVGRRDGGLSYYWNFGTKSNPLFDPDSVNSNFGNVSVVPYGNVDGFSQPFIRRDSTGKMILLVGSVGGSIYEYAIDTNKLRSGSFTLIDSDFIGQNTGQNATISIADINGDGRNEYISGNAAGGVLIFSDSLWDPGTILNVSNEIPAIPEYLHIYPNPAKESFTCELANTGFKNPKTEVFNLLGEKMPVELTLSENKIMVGTGQLSNGFYIVRISEYDKTSSGKVLLER